MPNFYSLRDLARWPARMSRFAMPGAGRQMPGAPPSGDMGRAPQMPGGDEVGIPGFPSPGMPPPTNPGGDQVSIPGFPSPDMHTWSDVQGLVPQVQSRFTPERWQRLQAQNFRPGAGVTPNDVYAALQSFLGQRRG